MVGARHRSNGEGLPRASTGRTKTANVILIGSLVVSGAMTADFSASIGRDLVSAVLLGGVGILLELLKAFSWDRARGGGLVYKTLGVLCSVFSLIASLAFSTVNIEQGMEASEGQSDEASRIQDSIQLIRSQEHDLIARVAQLPEGWVRTHAEYLESLGKLRDQLGALEAKLADLHGQGSSTTLAAGFAARLGWSGPWFIAAMLGVIALIIEVAIVAISLGGKGRGRMLFDGRQSSDSLAKFFREALNEDGTVKSRRELIALGWAEREVRDLIFALTRSGILFRAKRGQTLQLNQ